MTGRKIMASLYPSTQRASIYFGKRRDDELADGMKRVFGVTYFSGSVSAATNELSSIVTEFNAVYLVLVCIDLCNATHCSRRVEVVNAQQVL